MLCSFSVLQQDEHNLHFQTCSSLFYVEIRNFFSFKPKFNSSRTTRERKLEIAFIPSEVIPQPEK